MIEIDLMSASTVSPLFSSGPLHPGVHSNPIRAMHEKKRLRFIYILLNKTFKTYKTWRAQHAHAVCARDAIMNM